MRDGNMKVTITFSFTVRTRKLAPIPCSVHISARRQKFSQKTVGSDRLQRLRPQLTYGMCWWQLFSTQRAC